MCLDGHAGLQARQERLRDREFQLDEPGVVECRDQRVGTDQVAEADVPKTHGPGKRRANIGVSEPRPGAPNLGLGHQHAGLEFLELGIRYNASFAERAAAIELAALLFQRGLRSCQVRPNLGVVEFDEQVAGLDALALGEMDARDDAGNTRRDFDGLVGTRGAECREAIDVVLCADLGRYHRDRAAAIHPARGRWLRAVAGGDRCGKRSGHDETRL